MLLPASRTTIAKLLKKGWIERAGSTQLYRITDAGKAALRAEM
jgi:DNA-binding PadR family transcriptional regulator